MGEIPKGFVDQYYQMDPMTEDLFFDGTQLANGMVVLIATPLRKVDLHPPGKWWGTRKLNKVEQFQARIENQWSKISDISLVGNHLQFVSNYWDGWKYTRAYSAHHAWLVRLDSLEELTR